MVNVQCPNCFDPHSYSTYANGSIETGYCQLCSYESEVKTTKQDPIKKIDVARPRPISSQKGRR